MKYVVLENGKTTKPPKLNRKEEEEEEEKQTWTKQDWGLSTERWKDLIISDTRCPWSVWQW